MQSEVLSSLLSGLEPVAPTLIGIYKTPRSRKYDTLFVRRETPEGVVGQDGKPRNWELWWSETHLVGFFDWETVVTMIRGTSAKGTFDIRVNNRISR